MPGLLLLTGLSLALSLLLVPICRDLALRWNLVDVPDTKRKTHRKPIPRLGGVPVALAAVCSCLIVASLSVRDGFGSAVAFGTVKDLAPAAAFIFLVGLADDIFSLKPWQKLAGQILAGIIVVSAGVEIKYAAGIALNPWVGGVITVGWLVCCANAMNLIDGLDGLASGVALLACAASFVAALISGNTALAVAIVPLAGAVLGFLAYNFNPASIFLGDCGSLLLGFLLGCYGVIWSEKSATLAGMAAPLLALSIPLLDTAIAISRRFLRRQPIFGADRSHIHHRLLSLGFTTPKVALVLYLAEGVAGILAVFLWAASKPWDAAILGLFVCATVFGVSRLQYVEFAAVRQLMRNDSFRCALNGQIAVESLEKGLSAAVTPEECWTAIEVASKDFGFHHIEMQFAGHSFRWHSGAGTMRSWEIRIPISEQDWVELSHEFGPAGHSTAVVAFAEAIRKALATESLEPAHAAGDGVTYTSLVAD